MGLLSWILFGALAGWVASLIAGHERTGCLTNIIIGVLGAFIGGFLMDLLARRPVHFAWDVRSFVVAVIGAILLLAITGIGRRH